MTTSGNAVAISSDIWDTKIVIGSALTSPLIPGRREHFQYRDMGLAAATGNLFGANVQIVGKELSEPTGWHYHICDVQFVFMLKGWLDLQFEDGTTRRLSAGESLYIQSGVRHNEIASSSEFELLEVQVPAGMKTVACNAPTGMS